MPSVTTSGVIVGSTVERVWSIVKNILDYPKFMKQVVSVEVHDKESDIRVSDWNVLLNGNSFRWTEEAIVNDDAHEVVFEQIDGDLASWKGRTYVQGDGECTLVTYEISFDLGIPALAELLHPLGERAVRENCEQMFQAISDKVNTE